MNENGWQQIHAGVSLAKWSRLVGWDEKSLRFVAASEQTFEAGHTSVQPTYGRLISWLTFAVGTEYLCRGVCLIKNLRVYEDKPKKVIRRPKPGEDLENWSRLVNQGKNGAAEVQEPTLGTRRFTELVEEVRNIKELGADSQRTTASLRFLANSIRNRDAHQFVQNVRSSDFLAVPELLVPCLNTLLGVVGNVTLKILLAKEELQ